MEGDKAVIETRRGAAILEFDGRRFTTEYEVTRVDDWRDTPFGKVNFGHASFGPERWLDITDPEHPAPVSDILAAVGLHMTRFKQTKGVR